MKRAPAVLRVVECPGHDLPVSLTAPHPWVLVGSEVVKHIKVRCLNESGFLRCHPFGVLDVVEDLDPEPGAPARPRMGSTVLMGRGRSVRHSSGTGRRRG